MPVTFQEWEVDLGQGENGLPSFSLSFLLHPSKEVQSSCPLTCAYVETSLWQVGIAVPPCAWPACSPCWQLKAFRYRQPSKPILSQSSLYCPAPSNLDCFARSFRIYPALAERRELLQNERRRIGACGFPLHRVLWHLGGPFHVLQ